MKIEAKVHDKNYLALIAMEILLSISSGSNPRQLIKDCNEKQENGLQTNPEPFAPNEIKDCFLAFNDLLLQKKYTCELPFCRKYIEIIWRTNVV
ncbi:hypothetical protein [Flavobacterium sp.]|uniref:hypothetical protein n=1 Tax=Flavobacterium sp. TaxID=239 RepID=UPI0037C13E1A